MRHVAPRVVAVVYRGMNLFELGVVAEVFGSARPDFAQPLYRLRFARAEAGELEAAGGIRLRTDGGLALLRHADIVVIPGWRDPASPAPRKLIAALVHAHARGARIVSICAGAFVLAATGLLDGKRATTHWRYADSFRQRFPKVLLDPQVLYVDDGRVMTSAGSAAGIDACLHVVRQDHGVEVANKVARAMVTSPHRSGGQAQFVNQPVPTHAMRSLAPQLDWIRQHIGEPLTVSRIARQAAMSERTLLRRFAAEVGATPKAWLQHERVRAAQRLLESSALPLQAVAAAAGFATAETFRAAFRRTVGIAPSVYRDRFKAQPA